MAGTTLLTLLVKLGLDKKPFDDGLDNVESKAKKSAGGLGKMLAGGVVAGIGGAVVGVGAIAGALATTIKPAVALQESGNAASVVFGDMSKAVLEYGKNSAMAVGMSNQEFLQTSAVAGAMLTNLGMSQGEAADETINLTERAADMASIFNTDVATAMNAIQSGLKGEFNPLEQFGVSMKVATIEAKALEMGLIKQGEEMSNNAKMQATLSMMYEQTDKYAGDFLNTQDGLANSGRQFGAIMTDVKAAIGTGFLPALEGGMGILKEFGGGLKEVMSSDLPLADKMTALGGLITSSMGQVVEALPAITESFTGLISGIANGLVSAIPTIIPVIIQVMMMLVNTIIELAPMMLEAGFQILLQLALGIAAALPTLIPAIVQMMLSILMVIVENIPLLISAGMQMLMGLIQGLITAIPLIVEQAPLIIQALITGITTTLPMLMEQAPIMIMALVTAILEALPMLIDAAAEIVVILVETIATNLPMLISTGAILIVTLLQAIISALPKLVEAGGRAIKTIVQAIKDSLPLLKTAGQDAMEGFKKGVESKFADILASLKAFGKSIVDSIKGMLDIKSPSKVMMGIGKNVMLGLEEGINKYAPLPEIALTGSMGNIKSIASANGKNETNMPSYPTATEIGKALVYALNQAGMV